MRDIKDLIIQRQYNHVLTLMNRVNEQLKNNNIRFIAIQYHDYNKKYSLFLDFSNNIKCFICYHDNLQDIYNFLISWRLQTFSIYFNCYQKK